MILVASCALGILVQARQENRPTLVGWATLPIDTFAPGPTTGQFAGAGQFGHALPIVDKQVVQGFSAVIAGPAPGTYYVLIDNGFGTQANSADSLLRVYAIRPSFRTASGGEGSVGAVNFRSGAPLASFTSDSFITLSDPNRRLGFPTTADRATYYGRPGTPPVAPAITQGRLLTGADLDPESFRRTADGHFWFGDEFGPFLFETDATGRVLRAPIALDGVFAPENPFRGTREPNLGSSRGFEGLAMSPDGNSLFALLEGVVTGEPAGFLRINEFNVAEGRFTGRTFKYRLDPNGTNIGDMTAINDHEFLVVERNGSAGDNATPPPFKKLFRIDIARLDADRAAAKTEVVDLMNVADPGDLNHDGKTTFTFPFVTIEDVLMIDANTILVINDNNYPGGGGRGQTSDATEVLLIRTGSTTDSRGPVDTRGTTATRGAGALRNTEGTGVISGWVRRPRGGAVDDAIVTARSYDSGRVWTTTASIFGKYELRELPPGLYRLDADSIDMTGASRCNQVRVSAGESVSVDLNDWSNVICECVYPPYAQSARTIEVEGRILDERGNPMPHARLVLEDGAWTESDWASSDGSFLFRARPHASLAITASYPGYETRSSQVRVGRAGRHEVALSLVPSGARLDERPTHPMSDGCHCYNSFVHRRR